MSVNTGVRRIAAAVRVLGWIIGAGFLALCLIDGIAGKALWVGGAGMVIFGAIGHGIAWVIEGFAPD